MNKLIYLDNAGSTFMLNRTITFMNKYNNLGNPSNINFLGQKCQNLINMIKNEIRSVCPINDNYEIIWTSGASESNNTFIRSVVNTYMLKNIKIHILASSIEHKTTLLALEELNGLIEYDLVLVDKCGTIIIDDLINKIKPNTKLVTIMSANNVIGSINPINEIGLICNKRNILFHTDCVQTFNKIGINPANLYVDAFSVSFHKFGGPKGIGLLIINKTIIKSFNLKSIISGIQNNKLRGGTENIVGIAGAFDAIIVNFHDRDIKNSKLKDLKAYLYSLLCKLNGYNCIQYIDYCQKKINKPTIVIISPDDSISNILSFSIINNNLNINNKFIQNELSKKNIIIGIGSSCNCQCIDHVLTALDANNDIINGFIRISLSDYTTYDEISEFIKYLNILIC